jgi:hypothetical protein
MLAGITAAVFDYDLAFELRDESDDLGIVVTDFFAIEARHDGTA